MEGAQSGYRQTATTGLDAGADRQAIRDQPAAGMGRAKNMTMTPSERAAAIAAQARAKERAKAADNADKEKNRRLMPLSAAFIDAFTEVFGRCPRGSFTEGGRTVTWGKK